MSLLKSYLTVAGGPVPRFFYGTAWKEDNTSDLTYLALKNGFLAVDTANQRKHYFEEGVGAGLRRFLEETGRSRGDLFLQTKFTYARGQDHRRPYNEADSFEKQVMDSFESSLRHLVTSHIDSYVLHGPYRGGVISPEDLEVWAAMENLVAEKRVKFLGVSNVSPEQLMAFCERVKIKPAFVQNRCFARTGWDAQVRAVCRLHGAVYQGFSLLTANQNELSQPHLLEIAKRHRKSIGQIVFRFCQQVGMICLTGTSDVAHMREDLDIYDFELSPSEVEQIEGRPT